MEKSRCGEEVRWSHRGRGPPVLKGDAPSMGNPIGGMRSALPSGDPTNRSGEALEPPRDAGRGSRLYLQVLLSLGPLMLKQFDLVTTSGYWALKGLETLWGGPAIWSLPDVERLVWLRLPGDIVAGAAIAVFLVVIWARLLRALRG